MNISAKFQLIPHSASEDLIFKYFFEKFSLLVSMTTNQIEWVRQKLYVWLVEDHSTNISEKSLSKYLE